MSQPHATFRARFDLPADPVNEFRPRVAPECLRSASAARPKSGALRESGRCKKSHLPRTRAARRARWAAIDSRRSNGVDKLAVHSRVPRCNGGEISPAIRGKLSQKHFGRLCHGSVEFLLQHNTEKVSPGAIRILRSNFSESPDGNR